MSLKKLGACLEELYPYETRDLHETAFRDASTRTIEAFDSYRASSKTDIMNILMETERALPFSFRVHKEFYTAVNTGFMVDESRYLKSDRRGGHASAILGWKTVEGKRYWVCRNSWGEKWGDDGKFYISFDLMEKISKGVFVVYQGDAPVGSGILSSVKVFFQSIFSAISKLLKRLQNKDK